MLEEVKKEYAMRKDTAVSMTDLLNTELAELRESFIQKRLKEHYDRACSLGHEVFAIVIQGSQNYDLDLYTDEYQSDIDTRCIVLPNLEDTIRRTDEISYTYEFPENKEHIDFKDINSMIGLWKKANVQFLEILFSDFYYVPDKYKKYWEMLRENAEKIVVEHKEAFYNAIHGMALQKLKALKHPYPTIKHKIEKFGYDPKQAHHILRLLLFLNDYNSGKSFKDALKSPVTRKQYLLDLKVNGCGLPVDEIEETCVIWCNQIKDFKNNLVKENSESNGIDYWLDDLKIEILKKWLKENIQNLEVN